MVGEPFSSHLAAYLNIPLEYSKKKVQVNNVT